MAGDSLQFSSNLGPSSEASARLIQRNESEIKLLEDVRIYVERRARVEAEYAEKISKLRSLIKVDVNSNEDGFLQKAWKTYINETENKAITISQNVKEMQSEVISRLERLIQNKRELLKRYRSDRSRVDFEFHCSKDEVKRLSEMYRHSLKEADKAKTRLDEASNKGRGDKEWKRNKEKLDRSCMKLHHTHNDYVFSLKVANKHRILYNKIMVPYVLDSMQRLQMGYIDEVQAVMLLLFNKTNWCKDEFVDSSKHIEGCIQLIKGNLEYEDFLKKNRASEQPSVPFFFDETLQEQDKTMSGLEQDALALNDLTHDQLKYRMKALESQIKTTKAEQKLKEDALNRCNADINGDLNAHGNGNKSEAGSSVSVLEKVAQAQNIKREINELKCKEDLAEVQLELLTTTVAQLGDGPPPAYIQLDRPSTNAEKKDRAKTLPYEKKKPTEKDRRSIFAGRKSYAKSQSDISHSSIQSSDNGDFDQYEEPAESSPPRSLAMEPWFHGNIDRRAAERLLKADGDFLVREKSDGTGAYVVSVMCREVTKHFLLNKTENNRFKFEGDDFDSVQSLINYHHLNRIPIKSTGHILIVNPVRPAFISGDKFSHLSLDVQLAERLGNGHFGEVFRGVLTKTNQAVAIKTCRAGVDDFMKRKFLEEAEIMKPYDHPNVVRLIGICRDQEPYMILMELMPYGDLLNFLKKQGGSLGMYDLQRMGHDAAKGMQYLESKNTIHRDLAARNVLVGHDYVAKISDFGMSREEDDEGIYTIQTTKEIPIKWTAPEVWHYQTYTSKSDVWSYGILLWEIFSIGNTPYPGWNNKRTREMVETGYRLPMPSGTPSKIYQVMKRCWDYEPNRRITFTEIENVFSTLCNA